MEQAHESFGRRLRRLREEQGMTLTALAEIAGVTEGAVRQVESGGVKAPNFFAGLRMADALRQDPHVLAFGTTGVMAARADLLAEIGEEIRSLTHRIAALERKR